MEVREERKNKEKEELIKKLENMEKKENKFIRKEIGRTNVMGVNGEGGMGGRYIVCFLGV